MAKEIPTHLMQIELSGKGGLAPKFWGDRSNTSPNPERRYLGGADQMAQGVYNPFIFQGYMAPAVSTTKAVTVNQTIEMITTAYDVANQDTYFGGSQNLYHSASLDALTLTSDLVVDSAAVFTDMEVYQVGGVRKLFWSYNLTSTADIGISSLPYSTNTKAWLSVVPVGAFGLGGGNQHRLVKADNGYLYVLDGSAVHKIDGTIAGGTNGTVTSNVLFFPPYFILSDGVDTRGYMYITVQDRNPLTSAAEVTTYSTVCGVYIWDRQSTVVNFTDFISIPGIKSINKIYVAPNGNVRVMCVAANRILQIREFDGTRFNVISQAGVTAYPRYPKSVSVTDSCTYWLGADGYFYAHGSPTQGAPEAIFQLANLFSSVSNVVTGVIAYGSNSSMYTGGTPAGQRTDPETFYTSYATGGACVVKKYMPFGSGDSNGWNQTIDAGNIYTLVKYLPKLSTVKALDIFMMPASADPVGSPMAQVKIFFNQSSTAWATKTIMDTDCFKGYIRIPINKRYVNSIQLEFVYSTNFTLSGNQFFPSYGVLEYYPEDLDV